MGEATGYRQDAAGGPRVRSDIVDVYVFRRARAPRGLEFLQLLRTGAPLAATWHPVMGHVERGETAVECAWRELREEIGLAPEDKYLKGMWALEQVYPYYVAEIDQIDSRRRHRTNDRTSRERVENCRERIADDGVLPAVLVRAFLRGSLIAPLP